MLGDILIGGENWWDIKILKSEINNTKLITGRKLKKYIKPFEMSEVDKLKRWGGVKIKIKKK